MDNINILIKDKIIEETVKILRISITNYELFKGATIISQLYNSEYKYIKGENLRIEGDEFMNWGTDDQYIINWVCNKLGLELEETEIQQS